MNAGHLLAIDSSTESLCLAACGPSGAVYWAGEGGARASEVLLGFVRSLVKEAGLVLADLHAVAFASGPGAFTGLRTACATAQGLAFGLACPVLPLDSLMVVGEARRLGQAQTGEANLDLAVVMDARMGEVYAARYAWDRGLWHTRCPPALWRPADLRRAWVEAPPQAWVGSGLLHLALGSERCLDEAPTALQRAQALMSLAQSAWVQAPGLNPRDAHPLYLRDKVALTTAERWAAANTR